MTLAQTMTLAEAARRLSFAAPARLRRHPGRAQGRVRRRGRALPPLILVTDSARLPDPLAAAATLPKGAAVILRHYAMAEGDMAEGDMAEGNMAGGAAARAALARRLMRLCRARGLRLLIAGDGRLARRIGADGLHFSEALLRRPPLGIAGARRQGWLVTAAAHSRGALLLAARRGADAVLLSPVFPTASHPRARALGPLRFAALVRRSPLPVYALGGVTAANARRLLGSGAVGIAALGGIAAAPGPTGATGAAPARARNVVERRPHPV